MNCVCGYGNQEAADFCCGFGRKLREIRSRKIYNVCRRFEEEEQGANISKKLLPGKGRSWKAKQSGVVRIAFIAMIAFFSAVGKGATQIDIGQSQGCVWWPRRVERMEVIVTETMETVGRKEYPLTITRQIGLQEIVVAGKPVQIEELTIFESPLGRSRCFTRAAPEKPPEERAAVCRRIQEIAAQAMIDQGIW